jgi:CHAT domain-containing protein
MRTLKGILCLLLIIFSQTTFSQKLKYLKKADSYFAAGSYPKAVKTLNKFKSSIPKTGGGNYLAAYFIREARYNLAQGILSGFDVSLNNALSSSASSAGENSTAHGTTLLEVAEIYNDYGNYRLAREYVTKARTIIESVGEMNSLLSLRMTLIESEAMIEQGFCNEALALLRENETLFARRAVEKETYTENDQIKTRRVPEEELAQRFGDYAQCMMLMGAAYSKKGSLLSADSAFAAVDGWLKGKTKYLGETNTVGVENRFRWAHYMIENGNTGSRPKDLQLDGILNDLQKRVAPTNELAHEIYLTHLEELMFNDEKVKYGNVKSEYEKVLDKYFPKTSLMRINMKAVEFNSKLNRDKTKDLEAQALAVLNSKTLPRNYKTTIRILDFLYDVALAERRYANAEGYLSQIVDTSKDLYGETSPQYHLTRIYLANFYLDFTNKIEEANKIYQESYKGVVEKEIDFRHKDILEILNHLATIYELTDEYALASQTLKQASEAAIQKYRDDDILYGIELTNIARLGLKLGDYDKVDKDIKKALEVINIKHNQQYVEYEPAYVAALETQAKLYGTFGLFDEATANLDRSRRIISKSKNAISNELSSAEELTGLLIQLGRYADADNLLTTLFAEYEKLYGQRSIRLIEPLVERGQILLARGEYPEAERTALRANEIAIKSFGEASTKAAPTQKLMSDIYYTLGDFEKAETNITKALASQEKQFGRNHIEVAKSLAQLALIKFYKGDNRKQVERLMIEARDIMAAKLGNQNPQYAEILKNVAIFYISEEKPDIAFSSLSAAENIWLAKTGSKNNINLASIYVLTGDVYYQQKNFKKAEDFYNKSKSLYEKFFSIRHPEYVKVLSKLSRVNYMQKNYKASKRLIEETLANYEQFIENYFPALSEREKAKYWNTIKGDFEFYNTLAFSNLEDFKDLTGKIYNYQLLTKALLLSSSIKIRERIMNSTDEALKEKYNEWINKKELLTLALSMTPEQLMENEIEPAALQQQVERLEKDLSERSEDFGQAYEKEPVRFDMVAKSLGENEVAVEMVRYRYFDHVFTDSIIYAALYLRKDFAKPKAIILEHGKNIETRYFKYYRNAITGLIPDDVSYNVFWAPIYREIGIASSIYLSGDGVYNQINLEAIPTPDGRYVIDNSNIILVSNTRDLYYNKRKTKLSNKENTAYMFGNPTFYLTASAESSITPLPGTEKEVAQVQYMLKQKGWATSEFIEGTASEEKVKELNSPKIFHIATHGLYKASDDLTLADEIQGNEAVMTQNPLLRTGLLLKGAGDLLDKTEYNYNMDNGILTAYEAMSLNLDKTDLVVLSACETGLGDVEQGEGVYGLQRAFLVAGAKVLVMSMFKVDDEATQKLMLKFYQKWLNSGNLRQSFTDAKKELRNEYPEPIYWGAFMMIGLE